MDNISNTNDLNNLMKKFVVNSNQQNNSPSNLDDKIVFDKFNSNECTNINYNLNVNLDQIQQNLNDNKDINSSNLITKNSKNDSVREKISMNRSYNEKIKNDDKTKTEEDLMNKVNISFKKKYLKHYSNERQKISNERYANKAAVKRNNLKNEELSF